jgi:replication factor C subunit 1
VKHGLNAKCANLVKEMVTNCAVAFDGNPKRQVLIMDEVDGMSGGDRGGVADLIQSIKARSARGSRHMC